MGVRFGQLGALLRAWRGARHSLSHTSKVAPTPDFAMFLPRLRVAGRGGGTSTPSQRSKIDDPVRKWRHFAMGSISGGGDPILGNVEIFARFRPLPPDPLIQPRLVFLDPPKIEAKFRHFPNGEFFGNFFIILAGGSSGSHPPLSHP